MHFILFDTIQNQPDNLNDTVQEENLYHLIISKCIRLILKIASVNKSDEFIVCIF